MADIMSPDTRRHICYWFILKLFNGTDLSICGYELQCSEYHSFIWQNKTTHPK